VLAVVVFTYSEFSMVGVSVLNNWLTAKWSLFS